MPLRQMQFSNTTYPNQNFPGLWIYKKIYHFIKNDRLDDKIDSTAGGRWQSRRLPNIKAQ